MTDTGTTNGRRVAGKVALVTGALRGLGLAQARALAEQGARVVLTGRDDLRGETQVAEFRAAGHDAAYLHLDVTQEENWQTAIGRVEETQGRLDILVNNAGVTAPSGLLDCSLAEWQSIVAVNQTGVFLGMKHAARAMMRAGGGSIINIASVYASLATDGYFAYHASKSAVLHMTRAAAATLAPRIRVNCVTPGITMTEMAESMNADWVKVRLDAYPMGRAGRPEEMAKVVLFLASDDSSFVTGAEYRVDGGALAGVKQSRAK